MAYVLSKNGKPLMPCSPGKARRLLKAGKAVVVSRLPFVIRLRYGTSGFVQKVVLGIDSGYENIGFSAVSDTKELISGTVELDTKMSSRLAERAMYRRLRRSKLWYREPRFDNRKKKEGWLPPSVQRRYDTHIKIINKIRGLIHICKVIVETASFDIQKIMNPDIKGIEYQSGNLAGYENMRAFLYVREKGLCQVCGKKFTKDKPSRIHHIIQRKDGGTDRPENLALVHEICHTNTIHKKGFKLKSNRNFKPNTFMSIIHKRFFSDIPGVKRTFGYITKMARNVAGIEKTHANDAFIIAGGNTQERARSFVVKQKRRSNRAIQLNRNGYAPAIRKQKYKFQPWDLVMCKGKKYFVQGVHNKGKTVQLKTPKKPIEANVKLVNLIKYSGSMLWKI